MKDHYTAKYSGLMLSKEMRNFLFRRTIPFLDRVSMDKPLTVLLQEAYLQGLRDAVEVQELK